MIDTSKIKHIIFDIHGVLQPKSDVPAEDIRKAVVKAIAKKFGMKIGEARQFYSNKRPLFPSTSMLMFEIGAYEEYIESFSGMPLNAKREPEIAKMLEELKKKYVLYIASNVTRAYARRLLDELGIDSRIFMKIVCIDDVKRPKPFPDQLEAIVSGNKEEYVFLGDRMDVDIRPALDLGINAILVDNNLLEILKTFL